jgi:hypothetical protein
MTNWANAIGKPEPSEAPKTTQTKAAAFKRVANAPKQKSTGNEQKATQAVQVLVQWNNGLAMAAMMGALFETAIAITDREEVFREQAFAALVADEKLCDAIIRMGTKSAMLGLLFVYGTFAVGVAPIAREEMRTRTFSFKDILGVFKMNSRDADE